MAPEEQHPKPPSDVHLPPYTHIYLHPHTHRQRRCVENEKEKTGRMMGVARRMGRDRQRQA